MSLPIVKNLSGPQESIFHLSKGPQLHFGEKSKNGRILLNLSIFPLLGCCHFTYFLKVYVSRLHVYVTAHRGWALCKQLALHLTPHQLLRQVIRIPRTQSFFGKYILFLS